MRPPSYANQVVRPLIDVGKPLNLIDLSKHFSANNLGIHILTRKQTIIYPTPQPELAAAITQAQEAVGRLNRLNEVVDGLPAKIAEADAELVDLSQRITQSETDLALAEGDTSVLVTTVETLSAEFAAKRAARERLDSQLPIFNQRGEELNGEIEAAKQNLRTERHILSTEIRDLLADRIVEKAAEMADLRSLWQAFTVASDGSHDWLQLAHVSDPRHAMRITIAAELARDARGQPAGVVPGRTYDNAPNLLNTTSSGGALVQEIQPVLEPLKAAKDLLNAREYTPRKPRTSTVVLRSSSEGPDGRPDAPARLPSNRSAGQTETHRPQHLRSGHSPGRA